MDTLQLCKYLITVNSELINKTAMSNCHCIGLNSFIINENPKIRLFIAEPNCELFKKFDYLNPIIPIHPHKYDDIFSQLEGNMINHLYEVGSMYSFKKYHYKRLSDNETELELLDNEYLDYLGGRNNIIFLKSNQLHTANLEGDRCSWLVTETFRNKNFEQFAYHQDLIKRKELYIPIINGSNYLYKYFNL